MRLVGSGYLDGGDIKVYRVRFKAELTYYIYVKTEKISADFDVYVMDENKNVVSKDESSAHDARCTITPRWTGEFFIVVRSAKGYSRYQLYIG